MDTYLAIASKRDERRYAERPIPDDVVLRILDAGRLAGSAVNRQPWTFRVVQTRERVEALAETVYAAQNVLTAGLVVAITTPGGRSTLDVGRCAQNMMLAAWNEGIVSCPNGMPDAERAADALGLAGDERPALVLSFGYLATPRNPERRSAQEWSERANRRPLGELVDYV